MLVLKKDNSIVFYILIKWEKPSFKPPKYGIKTRINYLSIL